MKSLTTMAATLIMLLFTAGGCRSTAVPADRSTVQQLDLERYMGTWYEIARFDHSFERGLTAVTARYELQPNGRIRVINSGYKGSPDGAYSEAIGKAKQPDPEQPGKLKVAFFLFFYADYFVMELDPEYQWALIGSSSDKYLWILSRTPRLEQETLDQILAKAKSRGYDTDQLIWVEHK